MRTKDNKSYVEDTLSDMRVLVVEDQSDARALLRGMLMNFGITQIFEAADGKEALVFTDTALEMIDLVICDWNMPRLSGIELLRQMRSVSPDMPFLMLTGRGDIESVAAAKSSGVTAYICKPFSPAGLEAKLRVIQAKIRKEEKSPY